MPTLKIDGKEVTVEAGATLIRAAKKIGISIPHYCWHPGLSVAGSCRMCLVDVEKMPKPQIACHIQCQDGMAVHTQTEKVKKLREHVLEFLLVNHPLDCPVCDQAGECKLQDYYMEHGLYDSRLNENKIKKKKAVPIGPTVMLDSERCILCSRCVRFSDEITKTGEFGIFNRGDRSEIGLYPGKELNHKYSGNVVDICPVGALTDRDFRFKCRVWYLEKVDSVCPGCARGCNITVEVNRDRPHHADGGRVMRLKPRFNDDVNDWWICDAGRYGYKPIDQNRITEAAVRTAGQVKLPLTEQALDLAAVSFRNLLRDSRNKIAVLVSPDLTNEELCLARKLFLSELRLDRVLLVSARPEGDQDDFLIRSDKHPNRKGAEWIGFQENEGETDQFLKDLEDGVLKGLIVFGLDLISLYPGRNITEAIAELELSLFIGPNHNRTSDRVKIVIPGASYAEKEGTFTNFEGRVQRIKRALPPLGESKPESEILARLAERLGFQRPCKTEEEVFSSLSRLVPEFRGLTYEQLGSLGARVQ